MTHRTRAAYGDWQTPPELAEQVISLVRGETPAHVLEPTCGRGVFLEAAARHFPKARLQGYEINPDYVDAARSRLPGRRASVCVADFFDTDWERELSRLRGRILVTGNPPWVTSAELGVIGSTNLPPKQNFKGLSGYDALTGKSNFDVSEWMLLRLLEVLQGRAMTIAVICKSAVARRVIEFAWRRRWSISPGGLFRIDAMRHFGAAVDAVVFVAKSGPRFDPNQKWPVHDRTGDNRIISHLGVIDGIAVPDADRFVRTRYLSGESEIEWRSGVKHDCARVMELARDGSRWINGFGESVDVEEELLFPLLKSSDVANGRVVPSRAMVVTQRVLGEDTTLLAKRAPKAWAYLERHRALFLARRSAIYKRRPSFSVFGVGSYSFASWKVAVSGLYKRCEFTLVGPYNGRPVVLDDTCYFLPFQAEAAARRTVDALRSPVARDFFAGRVFWDAKRPINKTILQSLSLEALSVACGHPGCGYSKGE